jgi:hypothetical protein
MACGRLSGAASLREQYEKLAATSLLDQACASSFLDG